MMKRFFYFSLVMVFGFFLVSCGENQKPWASWKAEHVVFIGLDAWGSYSVEKADMPNVKQLMSEGAYTLEKRAVLPSSSAVNWASMFMGACPELHGYTTWGSKTPDLPSRELNENGIFPNIFSLLRSSAPEAEIGVFSEWNGIKYLVDTLSLNIYGNHPNADKKNTDLTTASVNYIKEKKPNLVAIIYDSPDDVGHADGHDTPEYYTNIKHMDTLVGEIIQAVKDAGIYEKSIIIVTADHGGIDLGHGGKTMMEMETPFIIAGKNVKNIGEFSQSMMQFDVASILTTIFNIEQPEVWISRPVGVQFN